MDASSNYGGGKDMKLGFDLDEVVIALCNKLVEYMKNEYNIEWSVEDFVKYDLTKSVYSKDPEYNEKITNGVIKTVCDPKFQITAKPFEGVPAIIRRLKKEGHTLHFVSCRKYGAESYTVKQLREHSIPFNSIHHLGYGGDKGMVGRSLNLDFFIDDHEEHLISMYKYKKRWKKGLLLFDRPWNRDSVDASKFTRVKNWKEITRHLGIHKR